MRKKTTRFRLFGGLQIIYRLFEGKQLCNSIALLKWYMMGLIS